MMYFAALDQDDCFVVPVHEAMRGRWCRISLSLPIGYRPQFVTMKCESAAGSADADTYYMGTSRLTINSQRRNIIAYIPASTSLIRITPFGQTSEIEGLSCSIMIVWKWYAALNVLLRAPGRILAASKGGTRGISVRLRANMAKIATGDPPASYGLWWQYFDSWPKQQILQLLASEQRDRWPTISAFICAGGPTNDLDRTPAALTATIQSLEQQALQVPFRVIGERPETCSATVFEGTDAEYIALIQAGEVIPTHGMALLADWIVTLNRPDAIYGDEDSITDIGFRHSPIFKPQPNHTLMMSGTLVSGVWLIRRSSLPAKLESRPQWAEVIRLEIWTRLHEQNSAFNTHRVPYIVSHRRSDCQSAPPDLLAANVAAHFRRISIFARVDTSFPLRVQPMLIPGTEPHVSIVVPSACNSTHVVQCLLAVLNKTTYPNFDIIVILSQQIPPDAGQARTIMELEQNDRIRVVFQQVGEGFNYPIANNYGVALAKGSLICLLNDDVKPINADWLLNMVGHFADPQVGVVGAKLYYPNDQIQHGGVIMGLAGLCDHVNRFLPRGAPGYASRSILDQELSAVTAACLLIERDLYLSVGGMDDRYASAFNDVDLCLKVRAAARSVVYSAQAEMYHFESMSYGRHYSEAEVARWEKDVALMRYTWHEVIADDPFHNPNLSLQRGHEWELAFPPRLGRNRAAQDKADIGASVCDHASVARQSG